MTPAKSPQSIEPAVRVPSRPPAGRAPGWRGFLHRPWIWRAAARAERVGGTALRLIPPGLVRLRPFPGYLEPPSTEPLSSEDDTTRVRARFARSGPARFAARVEIPAGTTLHGAGGVAGPLRLEAREIVCWNTDAFGYDERTEAIYQSHPWVIGVRPDGTAFGVLAETTRACRLDLRRGLTIHADDEPFPLVIIDADHPAEVARRLAQLTGTAPMPPRWALGYHQCRYSYLTADRVREIGDGFRSRGIPCDAIWMDIDYMHGYRVFTTDPERFGDLTPLTSDLHDRGFRAVCMIDPGVKHEAGYDVSDSLLAGGHAVSLGDGSTPFVGPVWPGPCVFPDFLNAETRAWWAARYSPFLESGIDGVWNDMNEPAVFPKTVDPTDTSTFEDESTAQIPAWARTMPLDAHHRADEELGGPGPHARYHNVYGDQMVRATREGVLAARPERRPFVLTRAGFTGTHRFAATWTGDNTSDWRHLRWSIPMVLNMGLSGQPFVGPDIGGFIGEATPELFARWMGIGALLPFARGHTCTGTRDHEPWSFGERTERVCRVALQRRSRLIPWLYTLFERSSREGLPVACPLFFADPADPRLRDASESFLLGDAMLVRAGASERIESPCDPMPKGDWRRFEPINEGVGLAELPELRLRAGAAIPLGPVAEHDAQIVLDPLELLIAPDENGLATGELYEDDGDGWAFRSGAKRRTHFRAEITGDVLRLQARVIDGDWDVGPRPVQITSLDAEGAIRTGHGEIDGSGAGTIELAAGGDR